MLNHTDSKSGFTFRQMREISEDELHKRIAEDENGEKQDGQRFAELIKEKEVKIFI